MKTQLSSLQQKQTFLKIMIFTLVTVIIWVGLTLFRTQQQTGISPHLMKLSEALNPNINMGVIDRVEQKRNFTAEELSDFPIYSVVLDKSGEEQVVVFTASDRSSKTGSGLETVPVATSPLPSPEPNPGGTVTAPPADTNNPVPQSPTPENSGELFLPASPQGPPPGT